MIRDSFFDGVDGMLSGERKWFIAAFGDGIRSAIHKYETRLSECILRALFHILYDKLTVVPKLYFNRYSKIVCNSFKFLF